MHGLRLQALSSGPGAPPPRAGISQRTKASILVVLGLVLGALAVRRGILGSESLLFFAVLIPSVILHELSHGVVALAFGDPTAKDAGRLTLNPVPHIDPFGTVLLPAMMVLGGGGAFGYAKPVPVTPTLMRKPRGHSLLVSLAGPATNIALVVLLTAAARLWSPEGLVREVVLTAAAANVILAVFNLLPLPPLDGSAVVERFLPSAWLVGWFKLRQYSMLILLALFVLRPGAFGQIIGPALRFWRGFVT